MARSFLLLISFLAFSLLGRASHILGGDLTWTCQGGDYVFQLVFYRNCNEADVNAISETINVWNHSTVSQLTANFVSREDLSPICTEVAGGPTALLCGTGGSAGNGLGAIEKVIYRTDPVTLTGTPPAEGWIFTFDSFSRSGDITNLQNPNSYGITLASKMYAIPNSPGGCIDNSAQFLQDPYFVSCVSDPYQYNMNAVDPDLDSLAISFGTPVDHLNGGTYNPPTFPLPVPYEPGFSATSPTPDASMHASNITAQVDPSSGDLTFQSFNTGNFIVKVVAQSYRNGILISEIEREMQLIVTNCSGTNNPPVIAGPFGGLFETTINAGDPINFNLSSTDVELLQDGSAQSNIMVPTGLMYGTNHTSTLGCAIAPCATLNTTPPITMSQGVTATFDWQTSCDHILNPFGQALDTVPYHFVFKIQDDYCPIPKVSYATVTINVANQGSIAAPQINCIQTDAAGDVQITWNQVPDPTGSFLGYEVHSLQNGLLATLPAIGTTSFSDIGMGGQVSDYYLSVISGCNGNTIRYSDTVQNIFLDVVNPSNGTAVLQWNNPTPIPQSTMNAYYHIYREYPLGTWSLYDSVPYGTTNYIDTIDICFVYLNYQIELPNNPLCAYISNFDGDNFEDMMTPDIPIISSIGIDTTTNLVNIEWNVNSHQDTYGYVIYTLDAGGIPIEIDTVWGINNTSYSHNVGTDLGPLSYTVAAFDSCWTTSLPPTYQTSAKAAVHTTSFLNSSLNICDQAVNLNWTSYVGWDQIDHYNVYAYEEGQPWSMIGTTVNSNFIASVSQAVNYCFVVEAVHTSGITSFTNISCLYIALPSQPSFNYLQVATVQNDEIQLRYLVDNTVNVAEVVIQREEFGVFNEIARLSVASMNLNYTDTDVDPNSQSYRYRVQIIDSCGHPGAYSNIAQTIFVRSQNDDVAKLNYIYWNPYNEFDGSILGYNIYRGINGVFGGAPIATVPNGQFSYEDDANNIVSIGEICYRVEVIESINSYNIAEISNSNETCVYLEPLIYIPNAFMPEGINRIFIPVISDYDPTDYDFTIFSRWGQPIFKTNDPTEGWDGKINLSGKMAQTGTYLYVLSIRDGRGNEVVRRGHVTLLK